MYALFDIGATKTRIATTKDLETFSEPVIFDTKNNYQEGIEEIAEKVREITNGNIESMAGGISGTWNQDKTILLRSPNMPDWAGQNVVADFQSFFDVPIKILNDAMVVGLGEATHGAGQGSEIVAYVTVSTGVGGARIVGGEIDEHVFGFEPGAMILDDQKTIEELVSGKAIEKNRGVKPFEIPEDDSLWQDLAKLVSRGIYNMSLCWSPNVFVLGGSMIVGEPAISVEQIRKEFDSLPKIYESAPEIKKASLGAYGGLYGAMQYLKNNKK